jgi:hypothetical protein
VNIRQNGAGDRLLCCRTFVGHHQASLPGKNSANRSS